MSVFLAPLSVSSSTLCEIPAVDVGCGYLCVEM